MEEGVALLLPQEGEAARVEGGASVVQVQQAEGGWQPGAAVLEAEEGPVVRLEVEEEWGVIVRSMPGGLKPLKSAVVEFASGVGV